MKGLSLEYQVLTDAVGPAETLDSEQRAAALRTLDWDQLERLAGWHRLGPLLWQALSHQPVGPAGVRGRLEQEYLENAARNLFLQAELARVLGALDAAGVAAMLLKGAALIEAVYADPALRIMCDLDILVPEDDIERAQAAVTDLGYRAGAALPGQEGSQEWMAQHHHHFPPLISPGRILAVELHHHLVPPRDPARFDMAGLWARARSGTRGPPHLLLAPEDLLLHLAVHSFRNRRWTSAGALAQVADMAWVLDGQGPDWDALAERAQAYGVAAGLSLGLFAAQELMGSTVPPGAVAALFPAPFCVAQGHRFLERRILAERAAEPLAVLAVQHRSVLNRVVPEGDWLRQRYGEGTDIGLARLYLRHLHHQVQRLGRVGPSFLRPWDWGRDVALNRWVRSLDPRERRSGARRAGMGTGTRGGGLRNRPGQELGHLGEVGPGPEAVAGDAVDQSSQGAEVGLD